MRKSIIKDSKAIHRALLNRKKELGLRLTDILLDATVRGSTMTLCMLSKYFNKSKKNNLTEEHILWLCDRYGIEIEILIGSDEKIITKTLEYDQEACLAKIKKKYKSKKEKDTHNTNGTNP